MRCKICRKTRRYLSSIYLPPYVQSQGYRITVPSPQTMIRSTAPPPFFSGSVSIGCEMYSLTIVFHPFPSSASCSISSSSRPISPSDAALARGGLGKRDHNACMSRDYSFFVIWIGFDGKQVYTRTSCK